MDDTIQDTSNNRSACTECQRRKQKCNREWPCNHCQKRKVAAKCRFNHPNALYNRAPGNQDAKRKRHVSYDEDEAVVGNASSSDDSLGIEALGYMSSTLFARLGIESKKDQPYTEQDWVDVNTSPALERALSALPLRPYMDALIQSFFNNVNFHYYIIYPPVFLQEYHRWWDRRSQHKSVSLQWTCLLIAVCACATQHLDVAKQRSVELDLGESAEKLAERYNTAARELGAAIPVGHYHIYNVQRLLHWGYWYKSEARFPECWHVLSSAVREAQELGFHRESPNDGLPEFDREMRRRLWCIMDTWDWQFSSGLCRPTIIDRSDCKVELPTLALEDCSPSPLMHMKLQSELIGELAVCFNAPKHIVTPADVQLYQGIVENWMTKFPPVYDLQNPDRTADEKHSWVTFHRYYIWTMGYLMIMNPIRPYMAEQYTRNSPPAKLKIRADGIYYSMKLIQILQQWVDYASHRDGRFHFIIFSLFDTAAVLSTAIIKDTDFSIPGRDDITVAVDSAVAMLRRLTSLSVTAKTSYDILSRLVRRMPRSSPYSHEYQRKRAKLPAAPVQTTQPVPVVSVPGNAAAMAPEPARLQQQPRHDSASPNNFVFVDGCTSSSTPQSDNSGIDDFTSSSTSYSLPPSIDGHPMASMPPCTTIGTDGLQSAVMYTDLPPPMVDGMEDFGFASITDSELGAFSNTWDWQSLNLDFISSQTAQAQAAHQQTYQTYA